MREVLIDMGATSTEVVYFEIEDGIYEVLVKTQERYLGGDDLTRVLMEHCLDVFAKRAGLEGFQPNG